MPLKRPGPYDPELDRIIEKADRDWRERRSEDGRKRSRYIEDEAEEASCDEVEATTESEDEITPARASNSKAPPVVDNTVNNLLHRVATDRERQQQKKSRKSPIFYCTPCKLEFPTLAQRNQHVGGRPHQRKVRSQNSTIFKCITCGDLFPTKHNLDVHHLSRRHRRKVKYLKN